MIDILTAGVYTIASVKKINEVIQYKLGFLSFETVDWEFTIHEVKYKKELFKLLTELYESANLLREPFNHKTVALNVINILKMF